MAISIWIADSAIHMMQKSDTKYQIFQIWTARVMYIHNESVVFGENSSEEK